MFKGMLGGVLVGGLLTFMVVENSSPGSTQPATERTRTAANNWAVTLGGMVSDFGHVAIPVASDLADTARTNFPNVLGPSAAPDGTATGGTAQHPTAPQP